MPQASDPKLLARLARLELRAKTAVEGLPGGRHVSHLRGSGTTFAEHRQYSPGDELRHLDWRLMARSDRNIVRRYEEETALTGYLVLDSSASMSFTSLEWTKYEYATWLAAALARLLAIQNDRFGLALTGGGAVQHWLPPKGGERHWQALVDILESTEPAEAGEPADALAAAAGRMERRGLVIWLSDCLGDAEAAGRAAARLRRSGHDLLVLRVLDPAEIDFPYGRSTRFEPLELGEFQLVDPRAIRQAYLEEFEKHGASLRRGLRALGADFRRMPTHEPLEAGLIEFLARRSARLSRVGR